jgi:hypothetical protein
VWIAAVAVLLLSSAACASRSPVQPPPSVPTGATSLTIVTAAPASGAAVDRSSVVVAELEYNVSDFARRSDFRIIAQFETADPRSTTDGGLPFSAYPELVRPTGRLTLSFPLKHVWDQKEIRRPFQMWFILIRRTRPGHSRGITRAGPLTFEVR